MKNRFFRGFLIGAVVFGCVFVLVLLDIFQSLEWKSWDLRLRLFSRPSRASEDIVLFLVDQESLDVYEQEQGLSWPWPRQMYSALVKYCVRGEAKALVFDLIFSESSVYGVEDDQDFAANIAAAGNVFLPFFLSHHDAQKEDGSSAVLQRFSLDAGSVPPAHFHPMKSVSLPLDILIRSAHGAGNSRFLPDADGIFRRIPLAFGLDDLMLPALPFAVASDMGGIRDLSYIPLDRSGEMIIRYYGPTGTYQSFSVAAIVNSLAQMEEGRIPQIPPDTFKNKIILIGASAPGLLDLRSTPLSAVCPGAEIQAAVIDNILRGDFIKLPSTIAIILWIAVLAVFVGIATSLLIKAWKIMLVSVFFFSLPAVLSVVAFGSGYWLDFVGPELAVLLSFVASNILNYGFEGRERRFIKNVFRHYLSPDVIEKILDDPTLLQLGGERREITSFFSDLADFTAISEALSPEALVELLNAYLSAMTEIILDSGGTLDKYEGDAIIAFWNAPLDMEDHATRACLAALECQRRLAELRSDIERQYGHTLHMRIGINSGPAVVGNMGSHRRFDYTAMGDTINLASRLEGACKQYRVSILISEYTYERAKEDVVGREVDIMRVVGKEKPVRVFELLGVNGEIPDGQSEDIKSFHEALRLYRHRKWDEALHLFQKFEDDTLAGMYIERIQRLKKTPPSTDWSGVFDLTKK